MDRAIDSIVGFSRLVANATAPEKILPYLADAVVEQAPDAGVATIRVLLDGKLEVPAVRNLPTDLLRWQADVTDVGFEIGESLRAHLGEERSALAHPLVSDRSLFGWLVLFLNAPLAPAKVKAIDSLTDLAAIALSQAVRSAELEETHQRLRSEHAKLIQAEKLSSIGLLAAGVAHEINNPLAGLMGALNRLRAVRPPEPAEEQWFELMKEALERIRSITRNLLDFARERPARREQVEVRGTVEGCIRLVASAASKRFITFENASEDCSVLVDRGQLMQSVLNVLLNAIHASPDSGCVRVDVRRDEGRIGIRISDQGPGIPESIRDRICDPFFTTKKEGEGTGLGLSITLGLVESNQGSLEFAGAEGEGAQVTLWFPEVSDR